MKPANLFITALIFATIGIGSSAAQSSTEAARTLGQPFSDCEGCPEVVPVPAGTFVMGVKPDEEIRLGMPQAQAGKGSPLTTITFARGFAMGRDPVTVAQFRMFVDETGYQTANSCFTQTFNDGHFIYEETRGYSWRAPGFPQADNHPVVCVSAEDAEAYAAWLSKKTGHRYAVPNEAQYEYALRAGTATHYFWGENDRSPRACEYSNQPDLDQAEALKAPAGPEYRFQCRDGHAWTSPIGTYKPNAWGLRDMQGNIWHWTSDCWNETLAGIPTDGSTRTAGDCDARSSRGGSYGNAAFSTYAGIRAPRHASYVGHSWGFRIVRND
jgi:formylglycine-generating enzyme